MDSSLSSEEPPEDETLDASFALLELCLEQLANFAPVEQASQLLDLLPQISVVSRRLILVELIKFDLATASEQNVHRMLEFYWPTVSSILPQEAIPFDLVLEEVQIRRQGGENPRWDDYRNRFPDLADTIGKWLAGGETEGFSGATSKVPELPVGETVDDFHILKQLGQGAFARVYLARQESMQRLVALKATSRGSEEPQALSQLDHANVVRVYDQREIADPPTILLYMQYLAGGTLADGIKRVRELPQDQRLGKHVLEAIDQNLLGASQTVPEHSGVRKQVEDLNWPELVAWIGIQLAEGLHYADGKGVLHRDVKPANILLSAEAIPKLADFNVSCSGLSGRAGAAAYFGGSLAYMSPEQLQVADPTCKKEAGELDGRSDLYALGIVLWELWQGRRPWSIDELASSWTEAVALQRDVRTRPFSPDSPPKDSTERVLEKVLRQLLSEDPNERPTNGKETAARLRLAFYPELANRFEPSPKSLSGWLLSIPVLLVSALIVFGPNTVASRFNYVYNEFRFDKEYRVDNGETDASAAAKELSSTAKNGGELGEQVSAAVGDASGDGADPPILIYFRSLSKTVNLIVFPLGGVLFLMTVLPLAHIVHRAKLGKHALPKEVAYSWTVGTRATLICAVLWAVSGCVFAGGMAGNFPEQFRAADAFHFFISLVLCGGVAWIYPYFGMSLLSILVYYPKLISPAMHDPNFDRRRAQLERHCFWYLVSAAAIPLMAVGLLMFRDAHSVEAIKQLVLIGVGVTGVGLVFASYAHRKIRQALADYARVLGDSGKSAIQI